MKEWYRLRWRDVLNRQVEVHIVDAATCEGYRMREATDLTVSAEGLVTEEDDGDDVLQPVRTTTGRLSVMCSREELIPVSRDNEWRVIVWLEGIVMFRGWLKSESFSMEYNGVRNAFQYTVIDDIEAMKCAKFSQSGRMSIGSVISSCLAALTGSVLEQEFGALEFLISESVPYVDEPMDIIDATVDAWQWKDADGGLSSCYDVMASLSESLGAVLRSMNGQVVMTVPGDVAGRMWRVSSSSSGSMLVEGRDVSVRDDGMIVYRGKHTMTLLPRRRHVTISSEGKAYEMEGVDVSSDLLEFSGFAHTTAYNTRHEPFPLYYKCYGSGGGVSINNNGTGIAFLGLVGSHYVYEDYWDTGEDFDPGSELDGTGVRRNLNFQEVLYLVQQINDEQGARISGLETWSKTIGPISPSSTIDAVASLRTEAMENGVVVSNANVSISTGNVSLTSGGISIEIDSLYLLGRQYGGVMSPLKEVYRIPSQRAGEIVWLCELEAGRMWWNGAAWQEERCSFVIESHENQDAQTPSGVRLNKTIDQMFFSNGYSAPITSPISGSVSLRIVGCWDLGYYETPGDPERGDVYVTYEAAPIPVAAIKSLSVKHCVAFSDEWSKKSDIRRREIGGSTGDTISASVALTCGENIVESAGLLKKDESRVRSVADGSTRGTLSDVLLSRYVRYYGEPQVWVRLEEKSFADEILLERWNGSRECSGFGMRIDYVNAVRSVKWYCGSTAAAPT